MNNEPFLSRDTRRYVLTLVAILIVGALFRLFHLHLSIGGDDQTWVITARDLFGHANDGSIQECYYSRTLFRSLLAVWGSMFGLSLETTCVLMFVLSAMTTVMVSQCARLLFGAGAGLAAAAIYATHPILVVYDVVTRPDQLALFILATYLFFFFKYFRDGRLRWLIASALLVGLSYAVKGYYILPAVPLAACLLLQSKSRLLRIRDAVLFSAAVALGLSAALVFHWLQTGHSSGMLTAMAKYSEYVVAGRGNKPVIETIVLRFAYLKWLFFDEGLFSGFVTLWGLAFLAFHSRNRLECLALVGVFVLILGFFAFMPLSLRPLVFVQAQKRYIDALVLVLSIGGGGALAGTLTSLHDKTLRWSLMTVVLLGFAGNLFVPSDLVHPQLPRYQTLEFDGLHRVVKNAPDQGLTELILPDGYQRRVPDSFYQHGVDVTFCKLDDIDSVRSLAAHLRADGSRGVFLPRAADRAEALFWKGDYLPRMEHDGMDYALAELLKSEGCSVEKVCVPGSAVEGWLDRFEVYFLVEPIVVGWVYRFDDKKTPNTSKQRSAGRP
ncbi:MAG: glycosyltransferase family 39 protein [Pirellulales bacterium]|nr:glycosyltransferase family 39 protein [Pirellulales bacterium]